MNIKKSVLAFMLVGVMLFTDGCVSVTDLTAEEKEIITLYAAKVVSKHNVRLSQGLVRYRKSSETEDVSGEEASEENTDDETSDTSEGEENTNESKASDDEASEEGTDEKSESENGAAITLGEAFAIDGMDFSYQSADIYNDLQGSNSYIEEPAAGNKYVGISFNATNTSNEDTELSLLTMNTKFTATLGSEKKEAKSLAMLLNDLPTYTGTIEAGQTKELSIYFEFSEEATKDLSSLSMTAEINGKSSRIKLK